MSKTVYRMVVGNVGEVYAGSDKKRVEELWVEYRDNPTPRTSGESLTLFGNDEMIRWTTCADWTEEDIITNDQLPAAEDNGPYGRIS